MVDLNINDIKHIREISRPEILKGCARAYATATTYFPVLLEMAEKYIKLSATDRIKRGYSAGMAPDGVWCVKCSDGYEERIGHGEIARDSCHRLASRLNGVL